MINFANNAFSQLAAEVTDTQTKITLLPGDGAKFAPALVQPYVNPITKLVTFAKVTISNTNNENEICHLTEVNGDELTVIRGQENTLARAWNRDDSIGNLVVAGGDARFVQSDQLQSGLYLSSGTGTNPNNLVATIPSSFDMGEDWDLKAPLILYPTQNNTGPVTLSINFGTTTTPALPVTLGNNTPLQAGDILANQPFIVVANANKNGFTAVTFAAAYGRYLPITGGTITGRLRVKSDLDVEHSISMRETNNFATVGIFMEGNTNADDPFMGYSVRTFEKNLEVDATTNGNVTKNVAKFTASSDTLDFNVDNLTKKQKNIITTDSYVLTNQIYDPIPYLANGWCKLPNGLILQWVFSESKDAEIKWPIPFPTWMVGTGSGSIQEGSNTQDWNMSINKVGISRQIPSRYFTFFAIAIGQ